MKKVLILAAMLAGLASAVNWDYPEELANECREALDYFLLAYENGCIDSIVVGGVTFPVPSDVRTYWRAEAVSARSDFNDAFDALMDYILER